MPSGRTHDRITLWGLPFVTGLTFAVSLSGNITLILAGAYLFSGLMFGPDLDLYSRQFQRWGYFRWIWIPYQKAIRHRSLLSHGLIIGTTLRILYLGCWLSILGIFLLGIAQLVWDVGWNWQILIQAVKRSSQDIAEWIALFLGLELGAISHIISDWGSSTSKRIHSRGKMKKRKSNMVKTRHKRRSNIGNR